MMRPAMILIVLLAASLSLTLFTIKYQVQDLEQDLVDLNRQITDDRQAIHVLKAEWSHLNEPSRLRILAERYLGMKTIEPHQVGTPDQMFRDDADRPDGVMPLPAATFFREPRQ